MIDANQRKFRRAVHINVTFAFVAFWGGVMWVPTTEEAAMMYARFLKAHHGVAASKFARKKASTLQDEGDLAGYKIWNAVADAVDRPVVWPQPRLLVRGRAA